MSERFYINLPLALGPVLLDGPEAHHLAAVCRLRPGNEVCLFNGDGREYPARITRVARREIILEILRADQPERELPCFLEVAASLPKGDRSQFLLEKLTELGVNQFVPLTCERSESYPREGKREKLERYVIEASKQCGRNVLMQLGESTTWGNYVKVRSENEIRIVAHPYPARNLASLGERAQDRTPPGSLRIAVGPEGGFTAEEIALAQKQGWQTMNLGPRILRVETAAIVLAARVIGWLAEG